MNTRQINGENTPKGGKDNTRVILTAAGAVAVGTAAGVAGSTLLGDDDHPQEPEEQQETQGEELAQNEQQNQATGEQRTEMAQARQDSPAQQQTHHTGGSQAPSGGTTTDTGTTTGTGTTTDTGTTTGTGTTSGTAGTGSQGGGTTTGDTPLDGDQVEAEALAVAERLVETDEIDAHDIDDLAIATFEESDILYTEGGTEIPVAEVTTPDGGQYLLADVNGDRIYDVVYDKDGDIVAGVQSGLNTNDAQLALDEDGGYLPITDDDPVFNEDDVDLDIVALDDTGNGTDGLLEDLDDDVDLDDLFAENESITPEVDDSHLDIALDAAEDTGLEDDLIDA